MTTSQKQSPKAAQKPRSLLDWSEVPNVGPAITKYFQKASIARPQDLVGQDPYQLFDALCANVGKRLDPCLLDTFIAAVRFMEGGESEPWWAFTTERKARLAQQEKSASSKRGKR